MVSEDKMDGRIMRLEGEYRYWMRTRQAGWLSSMVDVIHTEW